MGKDENTASSAVEEALEAVKKLIETVESKEDMKNGLSDVISRLAGKISDTGKTPSAEAEPSDDAEEDAEEDPDKESELCPAGSSTGFEDIFTEDALAGLAVGFVAGAAVVGGGVLIHKLLTK